MSSAHHASLWDQPRVRLLWLLRTVPGIELVQSSSSGYSEDDPQDMFHVYVAAQSKHLVPKVFEGMPVEIEVCEWSAEEFAADEQAIERGERGSHDPSSVASPRAVDWSLAPEGWDPTPRS